MKVHDTKRLRGLPLVDLAQSYGFVGRRFSDAFTAKCKLPGHQDGTPSFRITISRNTFKCFGCGSHGDVFDFVGLMDGIGDFHGQATRIEEISGIPRLEDRRTPARRNAERRAREGAPALAVDISDWSHGLELFAEQHKRDLVDTMEWALERGSDPIAEIAGQALENIARGALRPNDADPRQVANAYRLSLISNPDATSRMRQLGKDDREHAERITWAVIDLLVKAQWRDAGVAV